MILILNRKLCRFEELARLRRERFINKLGEGKHLGEESSPPSSSLSLLSPSPSSPSSLYHHHILKQGERFINKLGADKHLEEEEEEEQALNPMLFQLPSSHDGRAHYLRQSLFLFISNFFWSTIRENGRKLHVMSSRAVTMGRNALPRVLSRRLTLGEGGPACLCSHSCGRTGSLPRFE